MPTEPWRRSRSRCAVLGRCPDIVAHIRQCPCPLRHPTPPTLMRPPHSRTGPDRPLTQEPRLGDSLAQPQDPVQLPAQLAPARPARPGRVPSVRSAGRQGQWSLQARRMTLVRGQRSAPFASLSGPGWQRDHRPLNECQRRAAAASGSAATHCAGWGAAASRHRRCRSDRQAAAASRPR